MGRLNGFNRKEVLKRLKRAGFIKSRKGTNHELLWHPERDLLVAVPRHAGDIAEGTMVNILRQAGLTVDEFLAL